jgi:predicted dehydrogenase
MGNVKTAVLIGAGDRGVRYASYALKHPDRLKITAVAEPIPERRQRIVKDHNLPEGRIFTTWEDCLKAGPLGDGIIITTQDTMHVKPAVAAMKSGYQVLLEKPMALTRKECELLVKESKQSKVTLNVCHVLRYTDLFAKIKEILNEGIIGDICTVYHSENVSYYHMAHSYVRGNWRRSDTASPMILAKCCHDLDLIAWFVGSKPAQVSSMGSLTHFTEKNAPDCAPKRCTDGCPAAHTCLYHSVDTYLTGKHMKLAVTKTDARLLSLAARFMLAFPGISSRLPFLSRYAVWEEWPTSTICEDLTEEGIMRALKKGPYGRCVYRCDNDQVDHQETIIEFENGVTAMLKMHGHSEAEGRTVRIDGTKGTLKGKFGGGGSLEVHLHENGKTITYPVKSDLVGHMEGDYKIMENFVTVLNGGEGLTDGAESLVSHMLAFAAHESRMKKRVIDYKKYVL